MQSFSIQVSGAEESSFRCDADDTLLGGALRSGFGFHYECNSGGCGSCQFDLLAGEMTDLWPEAPGLSPRARQRGRRLACQSVPASDCEIRVLGEGAVPEIRPRRQGMALLSVRPLTADMAEFVFQGEAPAEFLAGQYALLRLPGVEGLRAYSMSNLANAEGEWRFIIKRVPGGKGTAALFDSIKPGDTVGIDGPYGNSYLRTDTGRDIVCIAGGSGLSPVLSILRGAASDPKLADRQLHLFYGARGPQDICLTELLALEPRLQERVILHTAISDDTAPGAEEWKGERGFVHELVGRTLGEQMPEFDFYFCGPSAMTDAVHRMMLMDYKVPAGQLHFDRFI